ncbi:MAG: type IV pilin protein [Pseudomonadota bacterium]
MLELMITFTILGILVGIAIPSWQGHLRKARRADAKISLQYTATAQETYFFQHNRYATKFSELSGVAESVVAMPSKEGFYAITMEADDFSWTMAATAVDQQTYDKQCASFLQNHLGDHSAVDADGLAISGCW